MKNTIKLIGLTFLIFILVTLITMKIETPYDGNDTYGFPFTFHIKWSGMCDPCPENPTETYIGYLLADITFAGLLAFGALSIIRKLKNRKNERELIQAKGEQPVPTVSDEELDFLISREFPNDIEKVKIKLDTIKSDSQKGKNRISASVLKLADKDFDKIDLLVKRANEDFRDIVSGAEYPRASSFGFGERNDDENKDDYLKDWEEYSTWKEKK